MGSISIDFPSDRNLGYLSYQHQEPIDIDGVIWPSIKRYVVGRKFSGTPLQEKIRTAQSDLVIVRLTQNFTKVEVRPDGIVTKKKVFLSGVTPTPTDFKTDLQVAMEAKFTPKMETFLKTFPFTFQSVLEPEYAAELTNFRNAKYTERVHAEKAKLNLTSDLPDLALASRLLKVMDRYVRKLKKIEKVKKDYLGLYDDALWNMAPHGKAQKILDNISIDYVMRSLPNQREVIAMCYNHLGRIFPGAIADEEFVKLADLAWATFRWCYFGGASEGGEADVRLHLRSKDLRLRPTARPYRKSKEKAPHLKSLVVRSEEYAVLFGTRPDYEALVDAYEKMEPMKRDLEIEKLMVMEKEKEERAKREKVVSLGEEEEDISEIGDEDDFDDEEDFDDLEEEVFSDLEEVEEDDDLEEENVTESKSLTPPIV